MSAEMECQESVLLQLDDLFDPFRPDRSGCALASPFDAPLADKAGVVRVDVACLPEKWVVQDVALLDEKQTLCTAPPESLDLINLDADGVDDTESLCSGDGLASLYTVGADDVADTTGAPAVAFASTPASEAGSDSSSVALLVVLFVGSDPSDTSDNCLSSLDNNSQTADDVPDIELVRRPLDGVNDQFKVAELSCSAELPNLSLDDVHSYIVLPTHIGKTQVGVKS